MSLLTVSALSYRTPERLLLDQISFSLHHGQKVVLVGRSGSGKSVLLQALNDLLPLTADEAKRIMLNKIPITQLAPTDYRAKVALFHQTPNLMDGTVLDNLKTPFEFKYHHDRRFDQAWHLEKLRQLGKHDDFIHQPIHELSGGERQLVSFLRTLQMNPVIALFDEATAALDTETAKLLMTLVLDWHDDDKAFIWVTHTPSEQIDLGADLWRMDGGVLTVTA